MTELKEREYISEIETLKIEVTRLRKELSRLSVENLRLQEMANAAYDTSHSEQITAGRTVHTSEKPLITENEMLKAVIDNMAVGVAITDNNGNVVALNKTALKLHGFDNEAEMLTAFKQFSQEFELKYPSGEELPLEEWPISRSLKGDYVKDYDVILNRKNSQHTLLVRYTSAPIMNDFGEVMLIVFNLTDVSELKNVQNSLHYERELFEGIFHNIPVMITIYDPALKYFRINQLVTDKLGYTDEDASRGDMMEKVYPDSDYRAMVTEYMKSLHPGWKEFVPYSKSGEPVESEWANIRLKSGVLIGIGIDIREKKKAEELLRENEERFRTLADNMPPFAWMADNKGFIFWFNKRWFDYTGSTPSDMQGWGWMEVHHPEHLDRVVEGYRKSIEQGENWEDIFPLRKHDGTYRWFLSRALPIRDSEGTIVRWFGTNTDVTEQRKAEENLRLSEQRLQGIFNNAAIGIVEIDKDTRFVFVNQHICEILGYSRQQLLQKTVIDITVPDDRETSLDLYRRLHCGELDILNYEKRYFKNDGSIIWVHVSVSAIRDNTGKHLKSIGTVNDISERKLAENALRESEMRFRMMADNISQMAWISDSTGKHLWFNKRWYDFTGIDLETMQGDGHLQVNHPDHASRVYDGFVKSIETGTPWEDTYMMKRTDGVYRWFLSRALPIFDEHGQITLWFGTSTDITAQKTAEEEARNRAAEIEAILSCIPYGILVYDMNGFIIRSNSVAKDVLQLSENPSNEQLSRITQQYEVLNENGQQLVSEDMPAYRASVNGETVLNEILLVKGKNLSNWYIFNAAPLTMYGKHTGAVLSMLDVSARKEMEERLSENEQRLQEMFDNAAIGIVEVDATNRIIAVNRQLCEILEFPPEELIGKTISDITWDEDRKESDRLNGMLMNGSVRKFSYEKRYVKKDNTPVWVNVTVSGIFDTMGRHTRSIGTVENISERKKIEKALKDSEEMFSKMIQAIPVGVALFNAAGIVYNVNNAFLRLTGFDTLQEISGKHYNELGNIGINDQRMRLADEYHRNGFIRNAETHFVSLHGRQHTVLLNLDNVQIWGKRFLLVTIEDISEQKKTEQEIKQKNEELTRFIYTVSHDLKSPLVTIKSFSSFLKGDIGATDKEAIDRDLMYIQNAADKMGKLLDELLELSRIGRKEEPKVNVPMTEVAQTAIDLVAGRINSAGAKVVFSGAPVLLYGYHQRLVQLYQNLIDNAVKFMGNQPHPLIEIGSRIEGDQIILYVSDNGVGIDPRYHHKIFGLFEKLENNSEGTGIGLALVKRIVEVHNGTVWFISEGEGSGTTFCFTLEKTTLL